MTFQPQDFRTIADDTVPPAFKIRNDPKSTLILVRSAGQATYSRTRAGKDAIVAQCDSAKDLLLWVWTGTYYTDVFLLSAQDVKRHYA